MNDYKCRFIVTCPDSENLMESMSKGKVDENLEDQYYEFCSSPSIHKKCLIFQGLSEKTLDR